MRCLLLLGLLGVLWSCAPALGHDSPDVFHPTDDQARAGQPQSIAPWAQPSISSAYVGYYVGGGCVVPRKGEPRHDWEGTWGWDYSGCWLRRHVELLWWHGRRDQGGTGAYQTDGPKVREEIDRKHEHE